MFSEGVWVTAVTPFHNNGEVDESSLKNLIDFYINSGVHGISLGVLGEVSKMTASEINQVIAILVEQTDRRVPVNVVCTSQGTKATAKSAKNAENLGAQTVMVAPPNNLNNDNELYKHYAEIAKEISIPIIVQDDPISTGSKISSTLLAKMANEIENIQFAKLEDMPTTVKISEVLEQTNKLKIIGGAAMFFYEELSRGAVATMSSFPYPKILVKIYDLFYKNEKKAARDYFYKHLPLIRYEEMLLPNVIDCAIITKEIFKMRNIIESSHVRKPSLTVDQKTHEEIKKIVDSIGIND